MMRAERASGPSMTTPADLVDRWRARARDLHPYAPGAAEAFAAAATELEAALATSAETTIALNDAARVSGYSPDHLGRLIRTGRLRNYGTRNRPRVRLGDLPRKLPAGRPGRPMGPTLTSRPSGPTLGAQ